MGKRVRKEDEEKMRTMRNKWNIPVSKIAPAIEWSPTTIYNHTKLKPMVGELKPMVGKINNFN